jgi:hypothetical protein
MKLRSFVTSKPKHQHGIDARNVATFAKTSLIASTDEQTAEIQQ